MLVRNTRRAGLRPDHARRAEQLRRRRLDQHGAGKGDAGRLPDQEREGVPVGALVLNMHASEIPKANYWQKVIAEEAIKALGAARLLRPDLLERHRPMAVGPSARRHAPRRPEPAS